MKLFTIIVGISVGLILVAMGIYGNYDTVAEAVTRSAEPVDPELFFGQEVRLNDEFFRGTKAVVVDKLGGGLYLVRTLEGPVQTVQIDTQMTLPSPAIEVIFTEGQWIERNTNE